jgi:regulator of sigma E protease
MFNALVSIVAFIVAVGLLVTFHELGHFWVARALKVKVLRFSVGFGKIIYSKTSKAGIEYCLSAIPLGGYVKMLDEREGEVAEADKPYAFNRQNVYKRIAIVLAGPLANFLLAVILFTAVFRGGMEGLAPVIGEITPDSYAQQSGLRWHDEITAVNNINTPTTQSVRREIVKNIDKHSVQLQVLRIDQEQVLVLPLPPISKEETKDLFNNIGFAFALPPRIGEVVADTPAADAGLRPGDLVVGVDDMQNPAWSEMVVYVSERPNTPIDFVIQRGQETFAVNITADEKLNGVGFIGVQIASDLIRTEKLPLREAVMQSIQQVKHYSILTLKMMYYMVAGKMSWENISGPVTIANVAGASAQIGLVYFLDFLAIISISLGVINLLPIPMLDGGHLLYYVVEIVQRKPVSEKTQMLGLRIGLLILVSLMGVALYNDILRLM